MEVPEEIIQQIADLQNQITDLRNLVSKNTFSNTIVQTKEQNFLEGGMQSANFVTGSTGWRLDANGDFEGNDGTFRGSLEANSLNIPDTTTANSFHVNTSGDAWWGATTIGSAVAKVLKTGAATFTDITATGTVNATGGFIGASTALVFESQGINCGTTGHVRGGQTDYATGTGWFLGYSGSAYKFSIGDTTNYMKWDGINLILSGAGTDVGAGDVLYASADTLHDSVNYTVYTKVKEIRCGAKGTLRIKFDLITGTGGVAVYGKVYRNGVAVGTEQSTTNGGGYTTFSEDISGWGNNDLIQLYVKCASTNSIGYDNFRVYSNAWEIITD